MKMQVLQLDKWVSTHSHSFGKAELGKRY